MELARRDAQRFAGRTGELRRLEEFLDEGRGPSVVFIHGPGGVGKSALVRELVRRSGARGFNAHLVEGRELPPGPDAIDDALMEARRDARPLIVFDTYERMSSLGGYLRRAVLPSLPDSSLVIIAGRRAPEEAWHEGGWENLFTEFRLTPVSDADAREILRLNGMEPGPEAERVLRWARGLPLALTMAARRPSLPSDAEPSGLRQPDVLELTMRRLVEDELDQSHADALAVAAIARVTSPEMLAEVLPDVAAEGEYTWLRDLSFAEPLGDGTALHELVAQALHEHLRRQDPLREATLRVRVADYLYDRARRGEVSLSIDLAHLAENPAIRWGYSWEMAAILRVDDVHAADIDVIRDFLHGSHRPEFWPVTERFLRETPEHVSVVRDSADRLRGYAIATMPEDSPAFAEEDALLGPRLAHARRNHRDGALLARDVYDVAGIPEESPIPMLGMASMLRGVRGNPRFAYLPINPRFPGAAEFAAALGAEHVAELDASIGDELIECHVVDYGPGGLLAAQREVVHVETGRPPPAREPDAADLRSAVRAALRSLSVPQRLAESPLAQGTGVEQRAASVRSLLEEATERCFGEGPSESLMRSVLIRGYLEPAPSHELAADELALSRSAYFRRLKLATERLADFIESSQTRP